MRSHFDICPILRDWKPNTVLMFERAHHGHLIKHELLAFSRAGQALGLCCSNSSLRGGCSLIWVGLIGLRRCMAPLRKLMSSSHAFGAMTGNAGTCLLEDLGRCEDFRCQLRCCLGGGRCGGSKASSCGPDMHTAPAKLRGAWCGMPSLEKARLAAPCSASTDIG